ncbi:MAG: hypothetical protein R3F61_00700 [Myxococcota bacterium]
MSPIVAGIGGLMIGLALGWFVGHGTRGGAHGAGPETAARQKALEEEQRRLAHEISQRDRTLTDMSGAQEAAEAAANENRKLIRRVRDLESALRSATSREDTPSAELEMQLAMAMRERDAAQKALMAAEARQAIERSRPPPDEEEGFDDLPDLDTEETDERFKWPGFDDPDERTIDDPAPRRAAPDAEETLIPPDLPPGSRDAEVTLLPDPEAEVETFVPDDAFVPGQTLMPDDYQPSDGDDLTRITGIGPATRHKLVDLGISSFADLAALTEEAMAELERQLGSRRPSRDDWRGQAAALLSSSQEDE